ncbi:unnamed protein product [Camellia sinensis]
MESYGQLLVTLVDLKPIPSTEAWVITPSLYRLNMILSWLISGNFWRSSGPVMTIDKFFGQGPDVGSQYRSIIFTNGSEESRLAAVSKEREQTKSKSSIVTTQIPQLGTFYPAEPEHQKFELKRNQFLLQLIGNLSEVELESSSLAAKLNSYSAELCPTKIQKQIDAQILQPIFFLFHSFHTLMFPTQLSFPLVGRTRYCTLFFYFNIYIYIYISIFFYYNIFSLSLLLFYFIFLFSIFLFPSIFPYSATR